MPPVYPTIPTSEQWEKDSSTLLSRRADDKLLLQIDQAIADFPFEGNDDLSRGQIEYAQNDVACELFFLVDYWLKTFRTARGADKRREPAMQALYRCVAHHLCAVFDCTINVLPMQLEHHFGRSLTAHGAQIDAVSNAAKYLDRAEREQFKLHWKNGLAYRWSSGKLVLADSRDKEINLTRVGNEFAGYVMSMSREFYMAAHFDGHRGTGHRANFYHSSYLAGGTVACAGSLRIDKGKVTGVMTDSGHYQPDPSHVVNVLRTLRMHGVDLSHVIVRNHEDQPLQVEADVFVNNDGSWGQILERGRSNLINLTRTGLKHRELGETIVMLWKDGVRRGTWRDDEQGLELFVGIFLQMWHNPANGKNTFAGVTSDYVVTALGRERSQRKQKMDRELFAAWQEWAGRQKASGGTGTIAAFVRDLKQKRQRAFHRRPDAALAEHVKQVLQANGSAVAG